MKTYINKISRLNKSNDVIANKLAVSNRMIHNHRKKFNKLVDGAIRTHFFTKHIPLHKSNIKDIPNVAKKSFLEKILILLRTIWLPFHRSYQYVFYR